MVLADNFGRTLGIVGSRWIHLLAGITWIGLLYYFNFVQTPAFAGFEAGSRTEATVKLVPRALWWFRWAAALTFLTGVMILGFQQQMKGAYFKTLPGMSIFAGALMATVMFLNVWLVIWPNQKIAIASAQNVMGGGEADPAAAGAARRGLLASRTNTLFSIPVMFFMVGTSYKETETELRIAMPNPGPPGQTPPVMIRVHIDTDGATAVDDDPVGP